MEKRHGNQRESHQHTGNLHTIATEHTQEPPNSFPVVRIAPHLIESWIHAQQLFLSLFSVYHMWYCVSYRAYNFLVAGVFVEFVTFCILYIARCIATSYHGWAGISMSTLLSVYSSLTQIIYYANSGPTFLISFLASMLLSVSITLYGLHAHSHGKKKS